MPIYEFHCKDCANDFSALRQLSQSSNVTCPACGTSKVSRLLSVTAKSQADSNFNQQCGTAFDGPCDRPGGCCRSAG